MNQTIKITIPQPCHQNWAGMTPTDKGRFCDSCQKPVMDFTRMGDAEIAGILKQNTSVCARVLPSQTERQLTVPHHRKRHAATLAAVAVLAVTPAIAYAQTPVPTERHIDENESFALGKVAVVPVRQLINGTVVDENNEPVAGASIIVKGTLISASTDLEGKFSIEANPTDVIQVLYVVHKTIEVTVNEYDFTKPFKLTEHAELMGDIVIVKKRTFFGRLFYRIGNLFR